MGSTPMAATLDCHLAQSGRARNNTFVAGYIVSLTVVEDESYFSLLSSGSWVRAPQWQLFFEIFIIVNYIFIIINYMGYRSNG